MVPGVGVGRRARHGGPQGAARPPAAAVRAQPDHARPAADRRGGGRATSTAGPPRRSATVSATTCAAGRGPSAAPVLSRLGAAGSVSGRAQRRRSGAAAGQRRPGRRVLITQYGVGSAGSSSTTCTAAGIHGRCTTKASGSAAGAEQLPLALGVERDHVGHVAHRQPGVVDPQLVVGHRDPDPAEPPQAGDGRPAAAARTAARRGRRPRPARPRPPDRPASATAPSHHHQGTLRRSA